MPGAAVVDTAAAVQTLIEEAKTEIFLISYAVHQGQTLFERVAARMRADGGLRVRLYLDIGRGQSDTSLESEIVSRFLKDFWTKHWPWPERPEIFYDPRALSTLPAVRASFHAKGVIVDRRAALLTSANFTEAAQKRNIEAGVLIRYQPLVAQLVSHFEMLRIRNYLALAPNQ